MESENSRGDEVVGREVKNVVSFEVSVSHRGINITSFEAVVNVHLKFLSSLLEVLSGPFRRTPKGHQNATYCSLELVLSGAIFYVLTRGMSIGMLLMV